MPFNPFVWNNTQPSPQQFISTGQTTILNNFQFLGSLTGVSTPGFIQFPNGLIIQWGLILAAVSGGHTLTFPTAFPNNLWAVSLTPAWTSTTSPAVPVAILDQNVVYFNTSNFKYRSNPSGIDISWIAIGN